MPSSTIPTSRRSASSARRRSRNISMSGRPRAGKRCAVLRRRQEPRHHHAGCRHGSDGRRADRRRIRLGGRALHGGVGRGARRQDHGRPADGKADSARREPEDRPLDRSDRRFRPAGDAGPRSSGSRTMSRSASRKAPSSRSTAAASRCRAMRTASTWAAACSTTSPRTCGSTRKRSSVPCCRWCAPMITTKR